MATQAHQRPRSIWGRLRPRFRLRTIFVLVTLLCVWLGVSMVRKQREERALSMIAAAGGALAWQATWFYPFRTVHLVSFGGEEFADAKLAGVADALAMLPSLDTLQIANSSITDAGLVHVEDLDGVHTVYLQGNAITDASIDHLLPMRNLRRLELSATLVSDACVDRLAEMGRLQTLTLPPAAGLRPAGGNHPPAVQELARLARESYSAPGVVSASAIRELRRRLPDCTIRRGEAYVPRTTTSVRPNPIPRELR